MGEAFIEPEVEVLSKEFDEVIILPMIKGKDKRLLPENVNDQSLFDQYEVKSISHIQLLSKFRKYSSNIKMKNLKYELSNFKNILSKAQVFEEWYESKCIDSDVHYSYWFDEWVTILGIVKEEFPNLKVVARAHGFDLYKNRAGASGFPYRKLQFQTVERVFPVSKNGEHYLKKEYPRFSEKIDHAYLGSDDAGLPKKNSDTFHLVSVANLIKLKRIDRVIDSLQLVSSPLKWTHIGEGKLMEILKQKAEGLPKNVEWEFKGPMEHKELLNFLNEKNIDAFISLSASEGLPVSMMEAQSAGIPIVSSNVGGVSEIVNDRTGILLDANPKPIRVAKTIESMIKGEEGLNFDDQRIRENWESKFDANKNFRKFGEYLTTLVI